MNPFQNKEKFDDFEGSSGKNYKNVCSERPPVFRKLTPSDAAALKDLRHQAIRECAWNFGTPPAVELGRGLSHYRRQLQLAARPARTRYLGLWIGHQLGGMAGVRAGRSRGVPFGLIFSMYLQPELRGKSYGRHLLQVAQTELLARWPVSHIRMHVEVHNRTALQLYESEGFQIAETERAAFRLEERMYDIYRLEKRCDSAVQE